MKLRTRPLIALVALAGLCLSVPAFAQFDAEAAENVFKENDCHKCHHATKAKKGPALKKIAAKYKGQDVVPTLMQKVRAGGKGNFGPIPMAPNPPEKINDADLKEAVEYILKN